MKPKGQWTSMRRIDLLLLVLVGILFSALTFNLGLYVGIKWGLVNAGLGVAPHMAPAHPIVPDPHAPVQVKAPAAEGKDWNNLEAVPQNIRQAFVKSKQSTLVEMQLRAKDSPSIGTSLVDNEAYFREQKLKWGQVAEADHKTERGIASENSAPAAGSSKNSAPGLFERSPAAVKEFKPTPGKSTVQIASYATEDEAIARVRLLIANNVSDAYYTKARDGSETWYRVSVGNYVDAEWAEKVGKRLIRRDLASEYFVRKVPD